MASPCPGAQTFDAQWVRLLQVTFFEASFQLGYLGFEDTAGERDILVYDNIYIYII